MATFIPGTSSWLTFKCRVVYIWAFVVKILSCLIVVWNRAYSERLEIVIFVPSTYHFILVTIHCSVVVLHTMQIFLYDYIYDTFKFTEDYESRSLRQKDWKLLPKLKEIRIFYVASYLPEGSYCHHQMAHLYPVSFGGVQVCHLASRFVKLFMRVRTWQLVTPISVEGKIIVTVFNFIIIRKLNNVSTHKFCDYL